MPRFAVDTNILAYSEGVERSDADRAKIQTSRALLRALIGSGQPWMIPIQVLAELHHVLLRRGAVTAVEAAVRTRRLGNLGQRLSSDSEALESALALVSSHQLQIFDALIVAAASKAGCDLLLSEDLHDGFVWKGVTVSNPFGPAPDARVAQLLARP